MRPWTGLLLAPLLVLGCSDGGASSTTATTGGSGLTTATTSTSSAGESTTDASASDGTTTGATGTTATSAATGTSAATTEGTTTEGTTTTTTTTEASTTEVSASEGSSTTGETCDPMADICCLMEGQLPPHALLESFLAAYPPANMPKSVAEVQALEPVADGHAMAWSDENVGNELVDVQNGGVIEANIVTGRMISRTAAEASIPVGAMIVAVREDPAIIEDLGTDAPCIGVGWGWGSILFEAEDTSIGEVVYLYVGLCSNGDVEAFFYSDQAVEICPPTPG